MRRVQNGFVRSYAVSILGDATSNLQQLTISGSGIYKRQTFARTQGIRPTSCFTIQSEPACVNLPRRTGRGYSASNMMTWRTALPSGMRAPAAGGVVGAGADARGEKTQVQARGAGVHRHAVPAVDQPGELLLEGGSLLTGASHVA